MCDVRKGRHGSTAACLVACAVLGATLIVGCHGGGPRAERNRNAYSRAELTVLQQRPDRLIAQLDNGLVVMAQQFDAAPVVSVQCWVRTGSIYEREYNGAGISHFLEHLASGGSTANRTESENNVILGEIGAQTNAATSLDTVRYYVNTDAAHTQAAVDLMSDWMQHSLIEEREYAREREVIQREFAMGRGEPSRIFWKLTQQARYQRHPARHPVIGYLDEFMKISRDQLEDFYHRMYVPNNMVFVVVGDIDPSKVVDQVATLWKSAERKPVPSIMFPIEREVSEPVELTGHADIDRPRLRLAWPGVRLTSEHDYPLDLLGQILGQGELSRLVQTVRNEKQLVTSIDAYNYSTSWGEGFFGIDAVVEKDKLDEAKAAILDEVNRLFTIGVTRDELERAKRKTIASVVYSTQTAQATAERMASDFIHTGDPDYLDRYAKQIERVTIADVQTAARKILDPKKMITIKLLPQEGEATWLTRPDDGDATTALTGEVELVELNNDKLVSKMRELEAMAGGAAAVVSAPVTMHKLPNGLRVLVQRNTRVPAVAIQWYHLGGLLADQPGREGVANAAAVMMMKGAGERSADEIALLLESLGAYMNTACGNSTQYLTAECLAKDWPKVLGLTADVVQRPTFAEDEWQKMQPRLLAEIDSQDDEWYMQLRNAFREAYFGAHPWGAPTVGRRSVVEALTPGDLRKFHQANIAAGESVLAVFGDVDEAQVIAEAQRLFGEMPANADAPFAPPPQPARESRIVQVETAKPTPAVQIGYGPGVRRENPDYAKMLVMSRVLDSFPVGWLDQALRGSGKGLVYAVGAGIFTGADEGYWALLFNTQPETITEATSEAIKVVDRIRTETVDATTLERARIKVLVSEALGRQSNSQRATNAALDELYGIGYDNAKKLIDEIRKVTAADVHDVANRYLNNPIGVILLQEKIEESKLPPLR